MRRDIRKIPTAELLEDRRASEADIMVCQTALAAGITQHRDGLPVQQRLDANRKIVAAIDAELARRKQ